MRRPDRFTGPYNLTQLLQYRQQTDHHDRLVRNRLATARPFMGRLELESELTGHTGCVNCLEWNETGTLLASGSDDLRILFWDPFRRRIVQNLATPHQGNIFSVKFMPGTVNSVIVTGAADGKIFACDRNHPEKSLLKCSCHDGRVKRLAVANETPNLFWSASEDGHVFQFDIREPHTCYETTGINLINLMDYVAGAEVKCIATNPRRPELLAVGANDNFARLYDRRKMTVNKLNYRGFEDHPRHHDFRQGFKDDLFPTGCVAYFSPGHLQFSPTAVSQASTYLTFSPDGRELLVNMGSEQIYLYDINNQEETKIFELPSFSGEKRKFPVPDHIDKMKRIGNGLLDREKFTDAINTYTKAILETPAPYPTLYHNRATAFMKRKWRGDFYAALRDCKTALQLDPAYVKTHFRMTRALLEMRFVPEAKNCLDEFKRRFPQSAKENSVMMLERDVEQALEARDETRSQQVSQMEQSWRTQARDFKDRFVGSVNTKTDIKEANFFGPDAKYIVSGSDDGSIFIFERPTGKIVEILAGDSQIVNCVQPHPYICMLASSGIDHEIRLWSPQSDELPRKHQVTDIDLHEEQLRMAQEGFEGTFFPSTVCRTS